MPLVGPGDATFEIRVKIDAQLRDQGWDIENPNAIRYEYVLPDGARPEAVSPSCNPPIAPLRGPMAAPREPTPIGSTPTGP